MLDVVEKWCPICGCDVDFNTGQCESASCSFDSSERLGKLVDSIAEHTKWVLWSTIKEPKSQRFIFELWEYKSYSIDVDSDGLVFNIYFHFWAKKYKVNFDYKLYTKKDLQSRKTYKSARAIKNLKIAQKVASGHSEFKTAGYYESIDMQRGPLLKFLKRLLFHFHN